MRYRWERERPRILLASSSRQFRLLPKGRPFVIKDHKHTSEVKRLWKFKIHNFKGGLKRSSNCVYRNILSYGLYDAKRQSRRAQKVTPKVALQRKIFPNMVTPTTFPERRKRRGFSSQSLDVLASFRINVFRTKIIVSPCRKAFPPPHTPTKKGPKQASISTHTHHTTPFYIIEVS